MRLALQSWEYFNFYARLKWARNTWRVAQERSARQARSTIGKQWFHGRRVFSDVSQCDRGLILQHIFNRYSKILGSPINWITTRDVMGSHQPRRQIGPGRKVGGTLAPSPLPTPPLPALLLGLRPSSNYTPVKFRDCILHGCDAIVVKKSVHRQTDRNINTWQSTPNLLCGSSCYSRCLQDHILPWWHTHTDSQGENNTSVSFLTRHIRTLGQTWLGIT